MIGLGIDLCEIARIERTLEKSDAFLLRFYGEEERAYLASRGRVRAESAAGMFAAKEAFLKAVGTGLNGAPLSDVTVTHDEGGCPRYALNGKALALLEKCGASHALLSITHDAGVAAAVCVIE